jgi:hypothetical protein
MGINHVLQVRKVQGEEERAMKRYDLRQGEFLDQRIDIVEMSNGKYVKYKDIKDDRSLLDDMAEVLQKLYDHTKNNMQICGLNSIASSVLTRYDIARAKERLG